MKKIKLGLFPKVVIAIVIGALLGLILPDVIVRILKTFNVLFAQLLKFVVPLLVLGLVTPSIANLGRGAGRMLLTVMLIAYCSTVCGALFSYGVSSNIFPLYLTPGELSGDAVAEKEFLPYIDLKIPPICDIMTALVLSFVVGVGIIFTDAKGLKKGFEEFGEIVKLTIENVIIPFLPVYIFTMICEMSARGVIDVVLGTGFKVILTGVVLSILYLVVQYCITGIIARRNPLKMLWNIIPAYLTGFSICSSSACIPVTYECTLKNGVRKDIADFVIPLCSTVHMCGSTIKLTVTSVAVAYMFGEPITFGLFMQFALMQAIAAVAAPGVMGGVLMASVGLLGTVLGFSDTMTTLMMTIYLALDGYGPAVNVSGDAAIAVIADRLFGKKMDKKKAEQSAAVEA
ncbi:MAG: dicarboxylate/amino acid:cation symporter [Bacteroidales bacterium]|nr:dicarboxylate/amino acid:cation symporter [Bacteroidales bacterium]